MEFSEETVIICRLCLKKFTKNCAPIGEVVQPTLNFLTLYPNLAISDNPMMCETCGGNLTKCFDFKTRCLSTEDCIASFAEGGVKKVDLRDIYSMVKQDGNIDRVPDDHSVCRFCLKLVKDDAFMSIRDDVDLIDLLQKYFLEMDLKIIDDIDACIPCYNSLQVYGSFVNNCINIEETIEEYCKVEGLNYKDQVDLRDVATFTSKSLLHVEDMNSVFIKEEKLENTIDTNVDVKVKFGDLMEVKQEEKLIDKEVQEENSNSFQLHASPSQSACEQKLKRAKPAKHTCEICGFQNKHKNRLKEHILTHKGEDLVAKYNCELCPFSTKRKDYLRKHMLRHKHIDIVTRCTMRKCDMCDYESRDKSTLKRHMLIHKNTSDITMYKCEMCSHETRYKRNLQQHMLVHMDVAAVYTCTLCSFETKWKNNFRKHFVSHRNTQKVVTESSLYLYKCDLCDYKANQMHSLQTHMLLHKTPSNITVYKCDVCDYETKMKPTLRKHMLIHKTRSEVAMYKCDQCDYETKRKSDLRRHLLSHRKTLDAPTHKVMYKCNSCDYESNQTSNLKRHKLTHKAPSEVTMYKCATCVYETRYKNCLQRHMLAHMDPSKVEKHKCELCPFRTKRKSYLRQHLLLTHNTTPNVVTPVTIYKCNLCDFEAKQESDLKGHILIHKTHSEVTIIKCDLQGEVKVEHEEANTDS